MEVSCKPDQSHEPKIVSKGSMSLTGHYTLSAGSSYFFPASCFHRTITKKAVTLLCRGQIEAENALVIRPINNPIICPFSSPKSVNECWDIIEDLLVEHLQTVQN